MRMHTQLGTDIRKWQLLASVVFLIAANPVIGQDSAKRVYENRLTPIKNPQPLLADYPEFVQPIIERQRFEAPILVNEEDGNLDVRAWRFSYNARGIIEMPNRLRTTGRP